MDTKRMEQQAAELAGRFVQHFERLVDEGLSRVIAERFEAFGGAVKAKTTALTRAAAESVAKAANGAGPAKSARKGAKLKRDMRCRVWGCPNQSKGPRFGYFCEKHVGLPAKEKEKARAEFAEKAAKA